MSAASESPFSASPEQLARIEELRSRGATFEHIAMELGEGWRGSDVARAQIRAALLANAARPREEHQRRGGHHGRR